MTSKKMSEKKASRGGGGGNEGDKGEDAPVVESFGFTETQGLEAFDTFEEMNIPVSMLEGIFTYGWEKPSPIQQKSIVPLMQGKDVIAQAQSGTGKTGAFSIGSISSAKEDLEKPQVLMLSPVRDLAIQTYELVRSLIRNTKMKATLCIGAGASVGGKEGAPPPRKMRQGTTVNEETDWNAQIVVGTPGRVWDSMRRGRFQTADLRVLILDEADEMLSKGFKDQIKTIFQYLPRDIQVGLFSATLPEDILELSEAFMREPVRILVKKEMLTLEGIRQYYIYLKNDSWKFDVLSDLYASLSMAQTIIFCNSKHRVLDLQKRLQDSHFTVDVLHGGMEQAERNDVMQRFRVGETRILLSTDIISRGIDIQQISLIINYDLPFRPEPYLHRIGRSGRYGRKGVAVNLVTDDDYQNLRCIEKFYNTQIESMPEDFMSHIH
jgi:superfamily II DNA/RNA helicase